VTAEETSVQALDAMANPRHLRIGIVSGAPLLRCGFFSAPANSTLASKGRS
jgi:hypothetical protein